MLDINRNPSKRDLNWFGLMLGLAIGFFGGITWLNGNVELAQKIWMVALGVPVVYYLLPPLRRFIYVGFMYAVFPIGWTVSHLILGAIFYGLFTPLGLILRMTGYDPMSRKLQPEAASYWIERPRSGDGRYFRQF